MSTRSEARRDCIALLGRVSPEGVPDISVRIEGLNKTEAEWLVDWLEVSGFPPFEVSVDEIGFVLHCADGRRFHTTLCLDQRPQKRDAPI